MMEWNGGVEYWSCIKNVWHLFEKYFELRKSTWASQHTCINFEFQIPKFEDSTPLKNQGLRYTLCTLKSINGDQYTSSHYIELIGS